MSHFYFFNLPPAFPSQQPPNWTHLSFPFFPTMKLSPTCLWVSAKQVIVAHSLAIAGSEWRAFVCSHFGGSSIGRRSCISSSYRISSESIKMTLGQWESSGYMLHTKKQPLSKSTQRDLLDMNIHGMRNKQQTRRLQNHMYKETEPSAATAQFIKRVRGSRICNPWLFCAVGTWKVANKHKERLSLNSPYLLKDRSLKRNSAILNSPPREDRLLS